MIALIDPLKVQKVELATEALAVWRRYAKQRPALLLLSDQPMLVPVPQLLATTIAQFVETATPEELARRSHPKTPDVLLMPDMTVDIALRLKWIGKLIWGLPLRDPGQALTLESFRQRLLEQGLAGADEAATLQGNGRRIEGSLRGVPLEMSTLDNLSPIAGPVIVHIDMSYFKNLYKNDIATPLLHLVFQTLTELRERRVPVLAVTFCYGNLDERIALDVRFVGDVIAALFAQPSMFTQPVPVNWERQGQILTLYNLFQKEKARELALAQEKELPEAAWVKFNLYQAAATHKEGGRALDCLAQAVALDNVYAMEYLALADMAHDKQRPDDAMRMLKLAQRAFPDNPAIRLKIAELTAASGDRKAALDLLRQLQALPWSTVYQAPLPDYLQGFAEYLQKESLPPAAVPSAPPRHAEGRSGM